MFSIEDKMENKLFKMKAALFDMDGVLSDTKDILVDSWMEVFKRNNISITLNELQNHILGVLQYQRIFQFINAYPSYNKDPSMLVEEAENLYRSQIPGRIRPTNGLIPFLDELKKRSVKMAVTTSARFVTMDTIIKALDIYSYFDCFVCAEDVSNRKPDPEVFSLASKELNIRNNNCVVFEDAPDGIKAAKTIDMTCIALKTTFPEHKLLNADLTINDFDNFPWHLFLTTME
jgi:beta-phosphoglucomutase